MIEPIITVIFSKDRACQLDLLLDSICRSSLSWWSPQNIRTYIIYTFSSTAFEEGYKKTMKKYENVRLSFVKQENFSKQLIDLVKTSEITGFITDDSLFYRSPKIPYMKDVGIYSCRYGFNTIIQDPFKKTYQPLLNKFINELDCIKWNSLDYNPLNNYGFQCSMDGHYYWSKDLLKMINFEFKNPSQLETGLFYRKHLINPWIRSEKNSSLVNIPLNNAGGYTEFSEANLEEINKKYLEGKKLSYFFNREDIKGCHQILDWEIK